MDGERIFKAKSILSGIGSGPALVSRERLGLRGFVDLEEGRLTGGLGELEGSYLGGAVLIFPSSKGSTLWSITLDFICRNGHAPSAMVNLKLDPFVTLGCSLQGIPLVLVEDEGFLENVRNGDVVQVDADRGIIKVENRR